MTVDGQALALWRALSMTGATIRPLEALRQLSMT
jgi:hypothetical protein